MELSQNKTGVSGNPLRIVLVNPPFSYFPGAGRKTPNYARPPLGIAYLASYVRRYATHEVDVRIVDCAGENIRSLQELVSRVTAMRPDVIGMSVVTATRPIAGELARQWKAVLPDTRIVLGGPHITVLPDEDAPSVDALFVGEGEESFLEYVNTWVLSKGRQPIAGCRIPGDNASNVLSRPLIESLDAIPFPARDLLPNSAYVHSYPHKYRHFTTMFASRGCPYNCHFCGNKAIWNERVRFHSAERVNAEIDHLVRDHGVDLIFFEDDTFLASRSLYSKVMQHIRENHPGLKWICHTRAEMLTQRTVREMEVSGCVEVQLGVESGNQDILTDTNKKLQVENVHKAFAALKNSRIKSWATFIIGHKGETVSSIQDTVRLATEIDPSYASFITMLPFPGTQVFQDFRREGLLRTTDWADYTWYGRPVFHLPDLDADRIVKLRSKAYRRFYLRPTKLWSILVDVVKATSLREILRNVRYWASLSLPRIQRNQPAATQVPEAPETPITMA